MKRILLGTIGLLLSMTTALAQETIDISTSAGYATDVYYDIETGSTTEVSNTTWDIAVNVGSGRSNPAMINGGQSVKVYEAPSTFADGEYADFTTYFEDLDTAGYSGTWTQLHNSETSWAGALDDFYWYDMNRGHALRPAKVFFVKAKSDNNYRKIHIEKTGIDPTYDTSIRTWNIVSWSLDNATKDTITIVQGDYTEKNFVYADLVAKKILDREPSNDSWDIVFTKFEHYFESYRGYYSTLGVFSKNGLEISQANGKTAADLVETDGDAYSTDKNVIGNDWKVAGGGGVFAKDTIAYFINIGSVDTPNIYKLYFTEFSGTTDGNISFVKKSENATGLFSGTSNNVLEAYPNPTTGLVNIPRQAKNITIYNSLGGFVKQASTYNGQVDMTELSAGIYVLAAEVNGVTTTSRISKK